MALRRQSALPVRQADMAMGAPVYLLAPALALLDAGVLQGQASASCVAVASMAMALRCKLPPPIVCLAPPARRSLTAARPSALSARREGTRQTSALQLRGAVHALLASTVVLQPNCARCVQRASSRAWRLRSNAMIVLLATSVAMFRKCRASRVRWGSIALAVLLRAPAVCLGSMGAIKG